MTLKRAAICGYLAYYVVGSALATRWLVRRFADVDDVWAAEVDALDALAIRVDAMERRETSAELALMWEGR